MILKVKVILILIVTMVTFLSCSDNSETSESDSLETFTAAPLIEYTMAKQFAHDTTLYTEGLLVHDGQLFESTGSPDDLPQCKSLIGIHDSKSGKFDKKIELDKSKYFGEGIVFLKDKLYQLTYKNQLGFVYDAKSFKLMDSFKFSNKEGWGLTTNGKDIIMSDGTYQLTFLDSASLKPIRTLNVTENGKVRNKLNELEYINGFIYANIWLSSEIVKIDPLSGNIVGKLDLTALTDKTLSKNPRADALNGIAYDSINDKIYITGKMWPSIYQLSFSH